MKDLAGKVAFVTGGASGLGLAMARSFTSAGMKVAIADIEDSALEAARAEFAESNADVITIKVDVTDRDALEAAAQETEAAFEKVHVVCNNAGVAIRGNIKDHSFRDWDWVMGVNLHGVVNGIQVFANRIIEHGEGGHIVNTASMAGHLGIASMSIYNTTKFAVVGLSECLQGDLEPFNVGVSVLCPGFVNTDIFSSQRNRPEPLGGSNASGFIPGKSGLPSDREIDEFKQRLDGIINASLVGDMVLHAIQENEFYIFTHPEFKQVVQDRSHRISQAFDRWANFRQDYE